MTSAGSLDMRERILNEAARLFVRLGYDGISMREIAEACGISKAGLYYHFKDKEALFLALLYLHLAKLEELLTETRAAGGTVRHQLLVFTTAMLARLPRVLRATTRLAGQELVKLGPIARAEFSQYYQLTFIEPISNLLKEGMLRGELRAVDLYTLTWSLLGLFYPFFNADTDYTPEQAAALAGTLVGIFFDGAACHE